jgi:probable F420-dependent oxidoreductase
MIQDTGPLRSILTVDMAALSRPGPQKPVPGGSPGQGSVQERAQICRMRIDVAYNGPPAGVQEAARQAVELGFEGLWTSETRHDPFLTLALAAHSCPGLPLGTGVAIALARSPFTLAQSAWDLAQLSQGNFVLGLGSQVKAHVTRRFSMPWDRPVARMREMVAALRAIWAAFEGSQPLRFEGEFYQHTLLTPNFCPPPSRFPAPPIGLAGVGPQMTALAGEVADCLLLHPFTHPTYLRTATAQALERGLRKAGRERSQITVVGSLFAYLEDEQAPRREAAVRDKLGFYGSTPAYHPVLDSLRRPGLGEKLHELSRRGEWKRMGSLIDDELLNCFAVRAPSQEELFARVRERFAGLYDRVVLTVPG